jgi:hypothetical protein
MIEPYTSAVNSALMEFAIIGFNKDKETDHSMKVSN